MAFDSDNFDLLVVTIVKAISNTFIDYRNEMGPNAVWFEVVRDFLLKEGVSVNLTSLELSSIGPMYVDIWRKVVEKRMLSEQK
jgi:hypothetical protein